MSGVLFYNKCRIKTDVLTSIQLTEAEEKDVNFYDYDGFRLLSYTNAEALALTELPANPVVNENLTFDEWNWTLAEIKNHVNNVGGVVNVGANYHTTDDKTHITYKPTKTAKTAYVYLTPSVANDVTVDWGDGSAIEVWEYANRETKSHTYSDVKYDSFYDITISCSSGTYLFPNYMCGLTNSSYGDNNRCSYTDIKLSSKVTAFTNQTFYELYTLETLSIPSNGLIRSFNSNCFAGCSKLKCVNIPKGTITIGTQCFYANSASIVTFPNTVRTFNTNVFMSSNIKNVTLPANDNFTTLNTSDFNGSNILNKIHMPRNITTLNAGCFTNCYSLTEVVLSNNLTSIGNTCFKSCINLKSIFLPNTLTSIGTECFNSCYNLLYIYCSPTTPPTLSAENAIPDNDNLIIYVPTGTISAYQNATYWSTFSSKMVEYNFSN